MEELYQKIRQDFECNLFILEDKPEETIDSTIKAFWNKAFGISISATKAAQLPFPQLSEQQKVTLLQLAEKRINGTPLVTVVQSDLFSQFESDEFWGKIDLIVCNPPYISSSKVLKMNSKIADNELSMAFDGGMIGLKIIQN